MYLYIYIHFLYKKQTTQIVSRIVQHNLIFFSFFKCCVCFLEFD